MQQRAPVQLRYKTIRNETMTFERTRQRGRLFDPFAPFSAACLTITWFSPQALCANKNSDETEIRDSITNLKLKLSPAVICFPLVLPLARVR